MLSCIIGYEKPYLLFPEPFIEVGPFIRRTLDLKEIVLNRIRDNPEVSTRRIVMDESVDHSTVFRILQTQQLKPYHLQRV